jgi:hypothetical protein
MKNIICGLEKSTGIERVLQFFEKYLPFLAIFVTAILFQYGLIIHDVQRSLFDMDKNELFSVMENASSFVQYLTSWVYYFF